MNNYTVYHLHSWLSILDSCTNYKDYIDKAVEYGMKSICFSEHGNIYSWINKKIYCDEVGIKYIHGCEVYLTATHKEKVRDNYHTILIAKNMDGFRELNTLIDLATTEDHTYYKPRISFDEFFNISDNIIKISACLASPLNNIKNEEILDKLYQTYDYFEIQYHNVEDQIIYNQQLYEASKKYNKPLIVGTDTHSLNSYKQECRHILKKGRKMDYADEDKYDLTFKSYDEVIDMFKIQNSLPLDVIKEALENTNRIADMCEEIILDKSIKYPKMSDNDNATFIQRVYDMCADKINKKIIDKNNSRYLQEIKEEIRVFKKLDMCSFMLFMSELCVWCHNNDIPTGFGRGSCCGSTIAYILDIIDVDPIKWDTIFSRFANEDRVEVGDIDLDFAPEDREKVYEYIFNKMGIDRTAYIITYQTDSDKRTIEDICRALDMSDDAVKIKKEYEDNPERTKERYPDIFYYFDGILGTPIATGVHPAGVVVSPLTLSDNYGTFWRNGQRVSVIDMEEIHECGLVKYDILGLKNVGIIKNVYEQLGLPYPKSYEINWEDKDVWEHMIDSPVAIFQFESDYSFSLLKKYKPQKINDMSLVNASLRPSGASYRDDLIARKPHKNSSKLIDDLLADNGGYLVFQEDTLKFLMNICGMSGSEADNVRRAIGRKQQERLDEAMPAILNGYCSKSDKSREEAEEEAEEFIQILKDSASYQFGYNHSTAYSMIGYMCAYLRYYYPVEFIASYLNNADNESDTVNGTRLAEHLEVKIYPPTFRKSKGNYVADTENRIVYKGIGSIKFLNEIVGEQLYALRDNKYNDFIELLQDLKSTSLNSKQLNILISINFFKEFGGNKYLLRCVDVFNNITTKKQFKKESLPLNLTEDEIRPFADKETEKIFKDVDVIGLTKQIIKSYNKEETLSLKEIFKIELESLGYVSYIDSNYNEDIVLVENLNVNKYGVAFVDLYRIKDGAKTNIKVDKNYFKEKPLCKGDIIKVVEFKEKEKKKRNENGKWIGTGIYEKILTKYGMVEADE